MSDPEEIRNEILRYLDKEPNLGRQEKFEYLKVLFDKFFAMNRIDHTVVYNDIRKLISDGGAEISNSGRVFVSKKELDIGERRFVAMIESFTNYLNKNTLLNRNIKLEYTEIPDDYELY